MKITLPILTAGCATLLAATTAQAQYSSDVNPASPPPPPRPRYVYEPYVMSGPFYVNGDIGGTLVQDMRVRSGGPKITFDPGSRFDVSFGFYAAPPISFEFETGMIWNQLTDNANQALTANGQHADLYQVPLLFNTVFHAPLPGGAQIYFGAGVGGVVSDLYVTDGSFHHHYTADSDVSFAYQAMAGVKVPVAPHMEVGVGYKFLGTMNHTFFDGDPNLNTHTGETYSHSILASFTFNF